VWLWERLLLSLSGLRGASCRRTADRADCPAVGFVAKGYAQTVAAAFDAVAPRSLKMNWSAAALPTILQLLHGASALSAHLAASVPVSVARMPRANGGRSGSTDGSARGSGGGGSGGVGGSRDGGVRDNGSTDKATQQIVILAIDLLERALDAGHVDMCTRVCCVAAR
jgi:hypothetical protein